MLLSRLALPLVVSLVSVGCLNNVDSQVTDLGDSQKPEGFLLLLDVVEDKTTTGKYSVTCATSDGKTRQETRTRVEIEKNAVCLPALPTAPVTDPKQTPSTTDTTVAAGIKITFVSTAAVESYLKAKPATDISRDKAAYQEGLDYCIVPKEFQSASICKTSGNEYKVAGAKITGCLLQLGYLFSSHFSILPSSVPTCQ